MIDDKLYQDVLKLVESGNTIQNACLKAGVKRETFYKNITYQQKKELKYIKQSNATFGVPNHTSARNAKTLIDYCKYLNE